MFVVRSQGEEKTRELGKMVGRFALPGTVIALSGELGAGKTVFVRGVSEGLEVCDAVSSPSFILMNVYRGRLTLYHFDFYRLENEEELGELGLEEYFYSENVCIIEWADRFPRVLPEERLDVVIEKDEGDIYRSRFIHIHCRGERNHFPLEELKRYALSGS